MPLNVLFNLKKIRKIIKQSESTIVHAWMYNSCLLVSIIKILYNMKVKLVWGIRCSNMQTEYYPWTLKFTIYFCRNISFLPNFIIYNSYAGLKYHSNLGFSNKSSLSITGGIFPFRATIKSNNARCSGKPTSSSLKSGHLSYIEVIVLDGSRIRKE